MKKFYFGLLSRLGRVWHGHGFLARFGRSGAFVPAMLASASALLAALEVLSWYAFGESSHFELVAFMILPAMVMFPVSLVVASRFGTAFASCLHDGTQSEVLARCEALLLAAGFSITRKATAELSAQRGNAIASAEDEWSAYPLVISSMAVSDGPKTRLEVQCASGSGEYSRIGSLLHDTCEAIAALDDAALKKGGAAIPIRTAGVTVGGLAMQIHKGLFTSALLGALLATGLCYLAYYRYSQHNEAQEEYGAAANAVQSLMTELERPARAEADNVLGGLAVKRYVAAERLNAVSKPIYGRLVIAVFTMQDGLKILSDGSRSVTQSVTGLSKDTLTEVLRQSGDLRPVRNEYFRALSLPDQTKYREAFDLRRKGDRVIVGLLLNADDIARAAEKALGAGVGVTFFDNGLPILQVTRSYAGEQRARVDKPKNVLPEDVVTSTKDVVDVGQLPNLVRYFLFGGNTVANFAVRTEERLGIPYRVAYFGGSERAGAGWSGAAVARLVDTEPKFTAYMLLVGMLGLLAFVVPALLMTSYLGITVAKRIAMPVLDIRDALRAIADGNFSTRINVTRTDEIGQLQRLVNVTADELRKREALRDLMGKYLSKQVAERILESDPNASFIGVKREVSVLFADVRGFTTYSERHPAEQVTKSLNEYFEVMVDVIAAHDGVLDKFIGDGLMVVFGAPAVQADHARRAIDTALEMQAALQTLNLRRAQRGDDPIQIGIGINSGLAISGNLGSLKRMEFTVIGDTVNLAARLESNAKKGQVLIGKATYESVKNLAECEALGAVHVKGKTEPVEVWWLKALKTRK